MTQHFLLSAAARTLSLPRIYRAGEDAAYETFCKLRWPETEGEAVCPDCGCCESYKITTRRKIKCKACHRQFSVTTGPPLQKNYPTPHSPIPYCLSLTQAKRQLARPFRQGRLFVLRWRSGCAGQGVTVPARIQRCQSDILSTAQRVRQCKRGAGYKQG
jgi:transposase-like protein